MVTKSRSKRRSLWSSWPSWSLWLAVAVTGAASPVLAQPAPPTATSRSLSITCRTATRPSCGRADSRRRRSTPGQRLRLTASGFAEGLLADRGGRVTDAIAEPQELNAAFHAKRFDLPAGLGRVVWGRLDELQPTDVINPIDVSRFFFEGRSEARLPVPLVRARVFAGDKASIEGVYVPFFRRGRFDRLDEPSSPFNLEPGAVPVWRSAVPAGLRPARAGATAANAQGGARVNATTGRVDWSVSAYRGFQAVRDLHAVLSPVPPCRSGGGGLSIEFPRFTMVGGDFETVTGPWVVRGEVAAFHARRVPGARPRGGADGAAPSTPARPWIARRGTTGSADRSSSTARPTIRPSTFRADGCLADRVGGSDLLAAEVPGPAVRRLQSQRCSGSCGASPAPASRQCRARGFARLVRGIRTRHDQPLRRQRLRLLRLKYFF